MTDTLGGGAGTGPAQTSDEIVPDPSEIDDLRGEGSKEPKTAAFAPLNAGSTKLRSWLH